MWGHESDMWGPLKCKSKALMGLSMAIVVLLVVGEPFLQNASENYKTIENNFSGKMRAETNAGSYHRN